ncbi:MAG: fused MFS/spermidine synthase [Deltaproteobacteria bacterium]|nr:fused MFS/spermidine synthase [Deltaproteobacteria bacterium]
MIVRLCFFLSGAAALVLEVLWTRILGHVFGATALAVSTTLTAFMAGLALGAYLGGRWAPELRRPVLAFAVLEIAVGFYGLGVPWLFDLLPAVQRWMGADLGLGVVGYGLLRFVAIQLVLLLPTTAMGATLPILAEGLARRHESFAGDVGGLYAANTFGAVAGAMLAGFLLIPNFGVESTVRVAAAMDLGVAVVVLLVSKFFGEQRLIRRVLPKSANAAILELADPVPVEDSSRLGEFLAPVAFAFSGAAAMALEVLWSRTLGVVIGASTYAFTLILVTFLTGLSLGAALMSSRVDRNPRPLSTLALALVAAGLSAAVGTLFVDRLPLLVLAAAKPEDATLGGIYAAELLGAAVVMLPAAVAFGTVMPLVLRLSSSKDEGAGRLVGRVYVFNTVGAILGSFLGGFVLLPLLGAERGITLAATLVVCSGVALAWVARPIARLPVVVGGVAAAVLLLLPRWDVFDWTAGMFRFYLAKRVYDSGFMHDGELLYHRDGIATTVTIERHVSGSIILKVNGKVDASDVGDMPTQVLSGLLPVLPKRGDKSALVIGFGSGVTSGALLEAPEVKRLRLVELEDAVIEASGRYFAHVNHRPFENPKFELSVDDGRTSLLLRDESYDVIVSEPSNPWMSGASSLFTQDFFRIAKRRLAKGGLFLQWLQLYELSAQNVETLFRTFKSVFPHFVVFSPSPESSDTLVVGSDEPIVFERAELDSAFADPALRAELLRAEIEVPEDLIGLFILRSEDKPLPEGPINTDDNALIEFSAPLDLLRYAVVDADLPFLEDVEGKRLERAPAAFPGFDFETAEGLAKVTRRLLLQGRLTDVDAFLSAARSATHTTTTATADLAALRAVHDRLTEGDAEAVVVEGTEGKDSAYAEAVALMLEDHDQRALDVVERAKGFSKRGPAHLFLEAYLRYRDEDPREADELYGRLLSEYPEFPESVPSVWYYAARAKADRGKYREAVPLMERFLNSVPVEATSELDPE